jgi:hypothetical protein
MNTEDYPIFPKKNNKNDYERFWTFYSIKKFIFFDDVVEKRRITNIISKIINIYTLALKDINIQISATGLRNLIKKYKNTGLVWVTKKGHFIDNV